MNILNHRFAAVSVSGCAFAVCVRRERKEIAEMTKTEQWENLTPEEARTLEELLENGVEVCAAPIEIEGSEHLRALGLDRKSCKTWRIGTEKIIVHLTPANRATSEMLTRDIWKQHSLEYRRRRCLLPGKAKTHKLCPPENRCTDCPYPDCRDRQFIRQVSWDELLDDAFVGHPDGSCEDSEFRRAEVRADLEALCEEINRYNPLYLRALRMREFDRMTASEIARELNTTRRQVYYYISEAQRLGKELVTRE